MRRLMWSSSRIAIFAAMRSARDDRQEQVRLVLPAGVDGVAAAVVVGVIVHVALAADAVARLHVEADAVALFEHHRSRPDLDVDLHDLAGLEIEPALVRSE